MNSERINGLTLEEWCDAAGVPRHTVGELAAAWQRGFDPHAFLAKPFRFVTIDRHYVTPRTRAWRLSPMERIVECAYSWPGPEVFTKRRGRLADRDGYFAREIDAESAEAIKKIEAELAAAEAAVRRLRAERNDVIEAAAARGKPVRVK